MTLQRPQRLSRDVTGTRQKRARTARTLPPRPVTRRDVKKFVDYCVILRAFWSHYQTVFEGSDLKRELLQRTAHKFFRDLNLMLIGTSDLTDMQAIPKLLWESATSPFNFS